MRMGMVFEGKTIYHRSNHWNENDFGGKTPYFVTMAELLILDGNDW